MRLIGPEVADPRALNVPLDQAEILVTNKALVGKPLEEFRHASFAGQLQVVRYERGGVPTSRAHQTDIETGTVDESASMPGLNTFLLVLAAIFPVVNPPGSALIFLGLTRGATLEIRRILARRVALNSFVVLVCSLLFSALILQFYGISIPILRVAGGFIVAVAGWRLLNEGRHKYI